MEEDAMITIEKSRLIQLKSSYTEMQQKLADSSVEHRRLEGLIKKMQLLSKSQAFLLRETLSQKLASRDAMMAEALHVMRVYEDALQKSNIPLPAEATDQRGAPYSDTLQVACERQRDENRRVLDPRAKGDAPVQKELDTLRKDNEQLARVNEELRKNSGGNPVNSDGKVGAGSSATEEALKRENADLKSELQLLQKELAESDKGVPSDSLDREKKKMQEKLNKVEADLRNAEAELKKERSKAKPDENAGGVENTADTARVLELEGENESLKAQLQRAQSEATELKEQVDMQSGQDNEQVAKLKEDKKQLKKELQEWEPKAAQMLEELRKEMKKKHKDEIKAAKKEAEKERDELVDAMGKELEQVETKAKAEKKKLKAEVKTLKATSKESGKILSKIKDEVTSRKGEIQNIRKEVNSELKTIPDVLSNEMRSLVVKIQGFQSEILELRELRVKFLKESNERKRLFNLVQELRGNIRVYCRCRPPSQKELAASGGDSEICVKFPIQGEIRISASRNREKNFEFDQVFDFNSTQESVYKEVSPLITSALDGYNVCIFAYGQTGTGKTFTMTGPPDNRGVNTRALNELFLKTQERSADFEDEITVSILEVYNEQIRDLLAENVGAQKYEVRQGPNGNYVPDLTIVPVESLDEVLQLMELADQNRSSACTDMNAHSSRSHLMLTVYLKSLNKVTNQQTNAKLNLIDLAGSERVDKSGVKGQALKEAQNINMSLSALGDVISSRANKNGHVPFRNSKLTFLLQDCLSGDSKTLMFVCISPVMLNSDESFCSMNFAERARSVELGRAQKNVTKSPPNSGRGRKK